MVMRLEEALAIGTRVCTSNLPPPFVATRSLVIVAVVVGLLILALKLAIIESAYIPQSGNSLINLGADRYAYY
jgi:hypothetical protein